MKSLIKMSNPHTGQAVQSLSPPHKNSAVAKELRYESGHEMAYTGRNASSQLGNYQSHND